MYVAVYIDSQGENKISLSSRLKNISWNQTTVQYNSSIKSNVINKEVAKTLISRDDFLVRHSVVEKHHKCDNDL